MLGEENFLWNHLVECDTYCLQVTDVVSEHDEVLVLFQRFQAVVVWVEEHVASSDCRISWIVHRQDWIEVRFIRQDKSVYGWPFLTSPKTLSVEEILHTPRVVQVSFCHSPQFVIENFRFGSIQVEIDFRWEPVVFI